jgi:hypothetical protein
VPRETHKFMIFHGVKLNDSLSSSNRGKPNLISEFTVERGMLGQFGRHGVVAAAVLAVSLSSVQVNYFPPSRYQEVQSL